MKRRYSLAVLSLLTIVIGCHDAVSPDTQNSNPQFAPGGVPGPPPWAIIHIPPVPPSHVPPKVPPGAGPGAFLTEVTDVGAGASFSCALRNDGAVFCWGANHRGQLGDGTQAASSIPVEVTGGHVFERIEVGNANACGLTAAGAAYCWGENQNGQLGSGSPGLPFSRDPVPVAGGHAFTDISIGLSTMCAVATDGVTYCWGSNAQGLFGTGVTGGSSNVPVAVPNSAALGFTDVSVAFFGACAKVSSGHYCWGLQNMLGNGSGSTAVAGPTLAAGGASFTSVDVGSLYACGLDAAGHASCWGNQTSGELGTGSTTLDAFSPAPVVGGHDFTLIDAHSMNSLLATTCALDNASAAWCWGANRVGELGGATGTDTCNGGGIMYNCSSAPLPVTGGHQFTDIAVGSSHVCALDNNDGVYCWGENNMGQLGDGTVTNSSTPVHVLGLDASLQTTIVEVTPHVTTLILLGSTQQLSARLVDVDGLPPIRATKGFTWSSSAPNVASVDQNGLVTALSNGTATIFASTTQGLVGRTTINVALIDPVQTFVQAYFGDGGATSDGVAVLGGLLADEWFHSGTFQTRQQIDQRNITNDNLTVEQAYNHLALARTALEFEAQRLQGINPANPQIGLLRALAGYTYIALAENFCSGVPNTDNNSGLLSTAGLFAAARNSFTLALQTASPAISQLANVGTARAALGTGDYNAAVAAAALVPINALITTSTIFGPATNGVFALNVTGERVSLSDSEGANGLPFRSATDPRVQWTRTGGNDVGFDGFTPQFELTTHTSTSALILANGIEARLIQAEVELANGNVPGFLSLLNSLRAIVGLGVLADPGTPAARADLLFSERAFYLFATGHRLGDLRRLIALYGRTQGTAFPIGPHHKGGIYGTDANLPVPASARGPAYTGCVSRTS